jgi:putative redox protein
MDAKVTWNGAMSFTGTATSGFMVPVGTRNEDGSYTTGSSPLELLAIGLVGCTGMDVISILEKKRQAVTGFEVKAHIERATEHPRIFSHVMVEYVVTGKKIDPEAVERAVELSVTKYCSAQAMLSKAVPIEHKITIIEAE